MRLRVIGFRLPVWKHHSLTASLAHGRCRDGHGDLANTSALGGQMVSSLRQAEEQRLKISDDSYKTVGLLVSKISN